MATITYNWATVVNLFFMNDSMTAGNQVAPAIAGNASGSRYFGAWDDPIPDLSVAGRAINADGTAVFGQLPVGSTNFRTQFDASVAGLANGNFVASFTDTSADLGGDIRFRLLDATGLPIGANFTVDAGTGVDSRSDVAALAGGGFAIAFQRDIGVNDRNLYVQRYDAAGTPTGGQIEVDTSILDTALPSITGLNDGGFAVAWRLLPVAGADASFIIQRFDAGGTAVGGQIQFGNGSTANLEPQLQSLPDGGFVAVYEDNSWGTGSFEISARVYNADGSARSSAILVNTNTFGNQLRPTVTTLANGFFVVGWSDGFYLLQQAFDAGGNAAGANFTVAGSATVANSVREGEIAGLTGGLVANVHSSRVPDASGDGSIQSSITELTRTTTGDAGNEILSGDALPDIINAGAGNDFVIGGAGADSMDGGANFDSVSWFGELAGVTVNLTNQTLNAGAAKGDTVANFEAYYLTNSGDSFTNTNTGGYVYGFGGSDSIVGGAGSDFIEGGAGGDTIDGGAGFDYASYANAATGVTLDLTNAGPNGGEAVGDAISNVEAFYLSANIDVFIGQTGQNFVFGGNGDDQIYGGFNASDWLFGEGGNDFLSGGNFDDLLSGGAGADTYAFASPTGNGFDSILDFSSGSDKILLAAFAFGLGAGTTFVNGVTFIAKASPFATAAQATVLYATGLGILYYDADGSGAGAAVALAQIAGAPAVAAGDIVVF
jgi:Ca2+-binding RTX toxin-like protein